MNNYHHISPEERAMIQIKLEEQCSLREIVRAIKRSPSTVSREIQEGVQEYNATKAGSAYRQRRARCVQSRTLRKGQRLFDRVSTLLECRQRFLEQISERLKLERPDEPDCKREQIDILPTAQLHR